MPFSSRPDPIRRRAGCIAICLLTSCLWWIGGCESEADHAEPDSEHAAQPAETRGDTPANQASEPPQVVHPAASISQPRVPPTTTSAPVNGCMATVECHQGFQKVAFRHAPVQAGLCDSCHEAEKPGHKFPLLRVGSDACTFCHPVIGHKEFLHQVIAKEGCTACHNPHGSNTKFLLQEASTELTCRRCHQIERKAFLHGPFAAGQCTACHQPHESDNAKLLIGGGSVGTCMVCHATKKVTLEPAENVHAPMAAGCGTCHEPHSSDHKHMLVDSTEDLCFRCHIDMKNLVRSAKWGHDALMTGDQCANCHDPHIADRRALLRDDLRTLCLNCHSKPQVAHDGRTIPDMRPALLNRKSLHGPVQTGECDACHEIHGASNARLLRKNFPPEFYSSFKLANYALCFECHNNTIVLAEHTTTDTNFRDGDRNLHYVHVHRDEKGRSCRSCHEIHGSDLPRHMASEVPFEGGGWSMPIGFEPMETGGRCSPGCHEPKEYHRDRRSAATVPTPAPTTNRGAP